tara:strand:+ start:2179 stop:3261 length:1083 start_codon:yes stop_codon:yes gene_type:complete
MSQHFKNKRSDITVDSVHNDFLNTFNNNDKNVLPKLENDLILLKQKKLSNIDEILDNKDKIKVLTKKISKLKKIKKDYFLNNSKYLFEYFENKQEINKNTNKKTLSNFFTNSNVETNTKKTQSVIDKYLKNVNSKHINLSNYITDIDICKSCNKGELIPVSHEGILICNHCSKNYRFLIDNEKPSYKEPPKEVCFYAYKRINHFREILAQFQAKETTDIPEYIIEKMKQQIKKERIDLTQMTNKKTKDILKKLGYNKYYEHIPFIKDKLGIKPPVMTPNLEETLCNLFMDIQAPYAKYCPRERVNFLNYYYTVYKLCELLNQTDFLPYFPMLKDREKRIEQDVIWKKICNDLGWEFIPTV